MTLWMHVHVVVQEAVIKIIPKNKKCKKAKWLSEEGLKIADKREAFSASIEIIIWFLSFNLLMWCITLIDLWILKNPCFPGIKPTWSWCMIFLMCCWILIARILLRIFASMFISDIGLYFSFFVASLSGFGIRVMVAS